MKAWRETRDTTPHEQVWVLIDTKEVAYILDGQWYRANDDYPIHTPFMWMPIPILPNE
jgi:hypothetical protein